MENTLQNILRPGAPAGPYTRPPPVAVAVVAEKMQVKVLKWDFAAEACTPAVQKNNKACAISDGKTVTKVTLFEELQDKLKVFTVSLSYLVHATVACPRNLNCLHCTVGRLNALSYRVNLNESSS